MRGLTYFAFVLSPFLATPSHPHRPIYGQSPPKVSSPKHSVTELFGVLLLSRLPSWCVNLCPKLFLTVELCLAANHAAHYIAPFVPQYCCTKTTSLAVYVRMLLLQLLECQESNKTIWNRSWISLRSLTLKQCTIAGSTISKRPMKILTAEQDAMRISVRRNRLICFFKM